MYQPVLTKKVHNVQRSQVFLVHSHVHRGSFIRLQIKTDAASQSVHQMYQQLAKSQGPGVDS